MPGRLDEALREKLTQRLRYYEDIGIPLFYRDRAAAAAEPEPPSVEPPVEASVEAGVETESAPAAVPEKEEILAKRSAVPATSKSGPAVPKPGVLITPAAISLFESAVRVANDSLEGIRAEIGEDCQRCKLCQKRNKIVFGDGNPHAELVFVGEGPGHDEDVQGLPFVGRAGKLLTQMIEAMGLARQDVYICNVVKCRPPENRQPEKDEVESCSPYLVRQIDAIAPKVIVGLGATASRTLLNTERGISQYRGEWQEFRGTKFMATYHPAYLLRNPAAKADVWKDLQKVMAVLGLAPKKGKPA
jgi:uracil-DNA glycosylase family 4